MGRLIRCLPIWAIAITCTLAINTLPSPTANHANVLQQERWSRQIDNSGFPGPTINSRPPPTGEDWIPINPNNDRSARVLNFAHQQPLFAAQQHQQIYQHPPPPQFLMQTQFIPPTFPGNDIRTGPISQSQPPPQFMSIFTDHRFGGHSQVPQQQALQHQKSPLNNPGPSKSKNTPFQFEFTANNHHKAPPLFQQLSPQFVNEQFFEIPDKSQGGLKKQPAFESKFNTESFNQKPKKPSQIHGQDLFHHPPPPPPPPQPQHIQSQSSAPSAPSGPAQQIHQLSAQPQQQQEEVQLLYVPLDTFYQQQQQQQQPQPQHIQQNSVYNNPLNQFINPNHINDFYTPQPNVRPLSIQTTTPLPRVPAPAKPKAHQPPLAMFMLQDPKYSGGITVNDILATLRRERSIAVLDAITPEAQPNVFIGPGGLKTPLGYEKFELPYLSAIDQTRSDRKLDAYPFFVAPLSYQAPNGFTKIPLPHPHVGSIVINEHKMIQQQQQQFGQFGLNQQPPTTARPEFLSPVTRKYNSNFIAATPLPQKFDPLTRKYVSQSTTEGYRQFAEEQQFLKEKQPTHLPKQSFVYQRPTESVNSDSGTKIVNEDFFSLKKTKPPTLSFENNFKVSSSQQQPSSAYEVFQQSVKSHTANHFETSTRPPTTKAVSQIKEFIPQTTPATYNTFSATPNLVENYQFSTPSSNSQYHEEVRSTTASSVDSFREQQNNHFEYTPISQEIPVSKPKKVVNKFNFGQSVNPEPTPTSAYPTETTRNQPQPQPTIPSRDVHFFNHQVVQQYDQPGPHSPVPANPSSIAPEPTPSDVTFYNRESQRPYESHSTELPKNTIPPSNLDFYNNNNNNNNNNFFNNHQQYTNDVPFADLQTTTEQYRLPSELPPINANLPNMINGLMEEMEEAQRVAAEAEVVTNPPSTRRPIHRGRRPVQRLTTSTTENVGDDEQVTSTRRPAVHRHRTRPPAVNSNSNQAQDQAPPQTRQHYRTSTIVRNPNRVRFNPSNEERTELKRNRGKGGNRNEEGDDKNLEYQRDVLNQNYPVINKAGGSSTTSTTTEAVQLVPEVESQNQFAYTPRDNVVTVMAESYPNFDFNAQSTPSTYFGQNQEEQQPQQPQFNQGDNLAQQVEEEERLVYNAVRNNVAQEVQQQPIEATSAVVAKPQEERVVLIGEKPLRRRIPTTTTETPQTTTDTQQSTVAAILRNRRPAFVRRPIQRTTTTTTETPAAAATTVASATQDRFTIRSRTRGEGVTTARNVPHIRGRLRQRTTTPAPENVEGAENEEVVPRKPVYRAQYRGRSRPKVVQETQETQETQWSLNHNVDSFQPLEGNDYITRKYDIVDDLIDNEPEIITADPNAEETFIFTVTPKNQAPIEQQNDNKEESFKSVAADTEAENEISPRFGANKDDEEVELVETTTEKKSGKRRGIWRRVRVRPADGFETAESQHIGQPAYNVLPDDDYSGHKFDTKATYNSFTKGFYGQERQEDQEIETASALTMEKEAESVTEEIAVKQEEEVATRVPEAKIDATEDVEKEFLYESTTVLPESVDAAGAGEETKNEEPSTGDSLVEDAPSSTTESIYDEVRKSLSELFSRAPEDETVATDLPETSEEVEGEVKKDTTSAAAPATTTTAAPVEETPRSDDEVATEIARVIELATEPEVKANVTEINRSYVIATSTSQQVSHETEICYRGRCIKSVEAKAKN